MIYQCYFDESQRVRLFTSPVYQGFGLEPPVNPNIASNCPELEDPQTRKFLSEYAAMLHHWRNPHLDPDPWIGFTSYRQLDKFQKVFNTRQEVESSLASFDVVGWGCYTFVDQLTQRPITMAEAGERIHPGLTTCLCHLLLTRNESMPLNYLTQAMGLYANYWVMSKANFVDYMTWSYPLVRWCLRHPDDPFVKSHPRSIGYLVERLLICWYSLRQKRVQAVGEVQPVRCGNPFLDPEGMGTPKPAEEQFITLSSWNANLSELCHRHRTMPRGIVHVGAHWAEEREVYRQLGATNVLWIEADPASISQLRTNVASHSGSKVLQACLAEVDGRKTTFYRTDNRGESSSILPMGTHADLFKNVHVVDETTLETVTFSTLVQREGLSLELYDFLVMDVQGAELLALKGFGAYLNQFNGVYIEVNLGELYQGCARLPEIDAYLKQYGFSRRETLITQQNYGDAFYLRDGVYASPPADLPQRLHTAARQLLTTRTFIYNRVGHDRRPMEMLENGKIGQGMGPLEQIWLLRAAGHDIVLEFVGSYGRTSILRQSPDGTWQGGYLIQANVPVELIPTNTTAGQQPVRRGYPYETNIPLDLADTLRTSLGLKHFVETGTRLGVTAKTMATRFEQVYTVELEPNTYQRTAAMLALLTNIRCILGDSATQLPKILREINTRCMLWLDAHWSGGDTGKGATECPVMEELAAAYAHRPDHIVLIDDARLFLVPPPPPHKPLDWPSYATITAFLAGQTPTPYVRVVGDVIVAGPPEIGPIVETYCRQHGL